MKKNKLLIITTLVFLLFLPIVGVLAHGAMEEHETEIINSNISDRPESEQTATIYFNEACGMCATYVRDQMPQMMQAQGINEIINKDYINDDGVRPEMNRLMTDLEIPLPLQSHIMTFIGDKYVLGGHVPAHIVNDLFDEANTDRFKRIIVYQDKMHGDVEDYRVWAIPNYSDNFVGAIKTYPIDTPITEYLNYLEQNESELIKSDNYKWIKDQSLLPTILVAGFLDGVNPCAFAVLLLFIAFLFSIKRGKKDVLKMGIVYILAIFLAYLLIGFGILQAVMFSNSPHFMAKLGSWLVIILGGINLINYFIPKFPIKLRIPQLSKETIQKWMRQATIPAAFVMGFLVGLCTFPCSGGIYVAIIGLLAIKTTYWTGVNYLLLYNFMFVLPLIIILILTSNPYTLIKVSEWQQKNKKTERLILGLVMVGLGAIILLFFI